MKPSLWCSVQQICTLLQQDPETSKVECNNDCKMTCCDGRCGQTIAYGPSDPDNWYPDLDWLEDELESVNPPKLVYIVNPCNPTG